MQKEKGNLIRCFSNVVGHKEAKNLVIDLNRMKSIYSDSFYIEYDMSKTYSNSNDDNFTIVGNVTKKDWDNLNLEYDFMEVNLL